MGVGAQNVMSVRRCTWGLGPRMQCLSGGAHGGWGPECNVCLSGGAHGGWGT